MEEARRRARRGARLLGRAQLEQDRAAVRRAEGRQPVVALAQREPDDASVPVGAAVYIRYPQGDARDVHAFKLTG